MRKKFYWAISAAIILAIIFYNYYFSAVKVEITTVDRGDIVHIVTDTGYVQSSDQAEIFTSQSGQINNLAVSVGQKVEKDQLLMVLGNPDVNISTQQLQIELNQARASADTARKASEQAEVDLKDSQSNFARVSQLFAVGGVSQAEFDNAKTMLDKASLSATSSKNNLQSARQQVSSYESLLADVRSKEKELEIRSPISGTLLQLPIKQGNVVAYGTLLAKVASPEDLEIKTDLLSDDLAAVKLGQPVQVVAPVLGNTVLHGSVSKIYPQAEEKTSALGVIQRRVPVIIKLKEIGNLKPGYETTVNIITASLSKVVIVPRESVMTAADGTRQVMQVVRGRVKHTTVQTGLADSKNIEIKTGLKAGDNIITDASIDLKENARVKS